jgi:TonB family protein
MAEPRYYLTRGNDNGQKRFYIAVGVSLAVHALFVTYFLFHKGPPVTRKFHTPMHMVELIQKAAPQPQAAATRPKPVAKPTPKPKPKAKPVPKTKPIVKAKPKPKVKTIPKKAADPIPQRTEADVRDRIAKLREAQAEKVEETPEEPQRTEADVRSRIDALRDKMSASDPAPATTAPTTSSGVQGARASGIRGTLQMLRFTAYKNKVWAHVKANWIVPPSLKGRDLTVIASVTIDRDGNILEHWIEEPSGNSIFDQSAIRALLRANPLPAVPSEIPDSEIKDGFGFEFK